MVLTISGEPFRGEKKDKNEKRKREEKRFFFCFHFNLFRIFAHWAVVGSYPFAELKKTFAEFREPHAYLKHCKVESVSFKAPKR